MGFLRWFGGRGSRERRAGDRKVPEAMVARVTSLSPRLRLVSGYAKRLAPGIALASGVIRGIMAGFPPVRQADAQAWATDPCIRAFFGTADDIEHVFSCSSDLREFFSHTQAEHVFAVLGMDMTERRTLGVALDGDVMRTDVPQTTVSFSDHRIRICAESEAALRAEIEGRLLDQLAIEGLALFASGQGRRDVLERNQALQKSRLRLLERQGAGLRSVVGAAAPDAAELAQLREQIEANDRELEALGTQDGALERQLECLAQVLGEAATRFRVERRRLRLSRMNVVLPQDSSTPGDDIELLCAHVPGDPPLVRWFSLVRYARSGMLSPMALLDEAERFL